MRLCPVLALAALAAGCTPAGQPLGCGPREVTVINGSALAVEQLYLGSGAPAGWGANLLAQNLLPPGASLSLHLPGAGPHAVRAVWVNGRAAELPGLDGCSTQYIMVRDAALQAG